MHQQSWICYLKGGADFANLREQAAEVGSIAAAAGDAKRDVQVAPLAPALCSVAQRCAMADLLEPFRDSGQNVGCCTT